MCFGSVRPADCVAATEFYNRLYHNSLKSLSCPKDLHSRKASHEIFVEPVKVSRTEELQSVEGEERKATSVDVINGTNLKTLIISNYFASK